MSLLQMSFAGGVMILAITVIRTLAINRLPKRPFGALGNSRCAPAAPVLFPLCI